MNFLEKKRLKFNSNALELIKKDPYKLEYIDEENQNEDASLFAVMADGFLLKYVKKPTRKICLEAIKEVMGDDFYTICEEDLVKSIEENQGKMLEITVNKDCIQLCLINEKTSIWEAEITEITLARTIYKEYRERVLRELEIEITKDDEDYILEQLEEHSGCLKNGHIIIARRYGNILVIECDFCEEIIADSDNLDYY